MICSVYKSFLQIIKKFSLRHKLHFLLILSYGLQVASTFHCTRNGFLASFRVHITPAVKINGHSLILPDECGHLLTIRNRSVAIKR